jgi:hypothetical protein
MGVGGGARCARCSAVCGLRTLPLGLHWDRWEPGNWEELGTGNDLVSGIGTGASGLRNNGLCLVFGAGGADGLLRLVVVAVAATSYYKLQEERRWGQGTRSWAGGAES